MTDYVVMPKTDYEDILAATREGTGKSALLLSNEVGAEIRSIVSEGAGEDIVPSGTIEIVENGSHDVTGYKTANVNVPIPDEYIVPTGELEITENGTHDVREYESVVVNIESSSEGGSSTETVMLSVGFGVESSDGIVYSPEGFPVGGVYNIDASAFGDGARAFQDYYGVDTPLKISVPAGSYVEIFVDPEMGLSYVDTAKDAVNCSATWERRTYGDDGEYEGLVAIISNITADASILLYTAY